MKELIEIINNNLGVDKVIHANYELNNTPLIIYKEYEGTRCVVLKDYNTLSPFFNNLIEADTWINTNS